MKVWAGFAAFLLCSSLYAQGSGRVQVPVEGYDAPVLAFVPGQVGRSTGLVLGLHGTGGSGPGFARAFDVSAIHAAGYVLALPSSFQGAWGNQFKKGGGWEAVAKDARYLRAVVEALMKKYNLHPDKIHAIGFSAGGFMSCLIAGFRDEFDGRPIRSACAHSGGLTTKMTAKADRAEHTSVWVLNGQRDRGHTEYSKNMFEAFDKNGFDAKYDEIPGKGHSYPLVPMSRVIAWWKELDKDAVDYEKIESALKRGENEMRRKNYGKAYSAYEEARKAAGAKSEKDAVAAKEGLDAIEVEAKRQLDEARALAESDPARAKKLLKKFGKKFARTPWADEAKAILKELSG